HGLHGSRARRALQEILPGELGAHAIRASRAAQHDHPVHAGRAGDRLRDDRQQRDVPTLAIRVGGGKEGASARGADALAQRARAGFSGASAREAPARTRPVQAVRRSTTTRSPLGAPATACATIGSSGTSLPLRYVTSVAKRARAPARRMRSPSAPAPKPAKTTMITTPMRTAPSMRTIASAQVGM